MTQRDPDIGTAPGDATLSRSSRLWQRLLDLWLLAVLATFLIIRVLGSHAARQLFERLRHARLQ